MFTFACIAGGLIIACTLVAILSPSGPTVTLSDVAQQMETMHGPRPMTSLDITSAEDKREV
jgi:hypothetical protein